MTRSSRLFGTGRSESSVRFRPVARRRSRVAIGVALVAVAVAGNIVIYSEAAATTTVAQLVRDVPAGETVDADDIRWIDLGLVEPSVRVVEPAAWVSLEGSFAKVRLVSGSLLVADSLQSRPLLTPGTAVVAITVDHGSLPAGLREQSLIEVVLPVDEPVWSAGSMGRSANSVGDLSGVDLDRSAGPGSGDGSTPDSNVPDGQRSVLLTPLASDPGVAEPGPGDSYVDIVQARVVALPLEVGPAGGRLSISIEVSEEIAHRVVAHDDPRIILIAPSRDEVES